MAVVAVALACGVVIERFIGLQSVLLVFLLPILASAILWGLLPSLFACVLGVLAFNFFLIPPIYTFTIAVRTTPLRCLSFSSSLSWSVI